jgi:signal peptide peptidase SppA
MNNRTALLAYIDSHAWAMSLTAFEAQRAAIFEMRSATDVEAGADGAGRRAASRPKASSPAIGILPIMGSLSYRPSVYSWYFGGNTIVELQQAHRDLLNDPEIDAILMISDSPGGSTDGIDEFASALFAGRQQKPLLAISDACCCSAAYYLCSQANDFAASPSSVTGSIGVIAMHLDISQALAQDGITPTIITYGANKAEQSPFAPLSPEARAHVQSGVDEAGRSFEAAVARGRSVSTTKIQRDFGQGRYYPAKEAVSRGLVDRVATFDQMVTRAASLGLSTSGHRHARAAASRREAVELDWLLSDSPAARQLGRERRAERERAEADKDLLEMQLAVRSRV